MAGSPRLTRSRVSTPKANADTPPNTALSKVSKPRARSQTARGGTKQRLRATRLLSDGTRSAQEPVPGKGVGPLKSHASGEIERVESALGVR
jgi:hypothetical protein